MSIWNKLKTVGTTTLIAASLTSITYASELVGYEIKKFTPEHRDEPMQVHTWYPATGGVQQTIGENAVFVGEPILANAQATPGKYPVILLSHGSGGNAANLSWIASFMASKGAIVMAPNHPGTTSGDSIQKETTKIWERPMDFRSMLDDIERLLPAGTKRDEARTGIMGFSLGGYSALSLAGARASKFAYISYCKKNRSNFDCGWLADGGVDLEQINQEKYDMSHKDNRISFSIAVDPALSAAYKSDSLSAIEVPVSIINLGDKEHIPAAINAREIPGQIPDATYHEIKGSSHFSFLGLCTKKAKYILLLTGEDPICTDPDGSERTVIHAEIKSLISTFLDQQLQNSH